MKRLTLSCAHVPMCVAVMYRTLFMSKQSNAPSEDFASSSLTRASRSRRSRSKSIRCSQSTAIVPNVFSAMPDLPCRLAVWWLVVYSASTELPTTDYQLPTTN